MAGLVAVVAGGLMLRAEAPAQFGTVPALASPQLPAAAVIVAAAPGTRAAPVQGVGPNTAPGRTADRRPVRLVLPRLAVSAPVVPVSVGTGGALDVPDDPAVLGWWKGSAAPGAGRGSVVIDGHVDSARYGIGVFARLRRLSVGDQVEVSTTAGRTVRYAVAGRRYYGKEDLPAAVFDQSLRERLVLITCGGRYDRHTGHYSQNVVLYAVPVGGNS